MQRTNYRWETRGSSKSNTAVVSDDALIWTSRPQEEENGASSVVGRFVWRPSGEFLRIKKAQFLWASTLKVLVIDVVAEVVDVVKKYTLCIAETAKLSHLFSSKQSSLS